MEWASRRQRAMGSFAEVLVWGPNPESLADWAVAEIEHCEVCWSRFRTDSELHGLNARAGLGPTKVSPLLWEALVFATRAFTETRGLFDPTVLESLLALGYDRSFPFPTPLADHDPCVRSASGFATVELDTANHAVSLPHGCGLDLGGIGKGLAADRVVEGLIARGAVSACVSMGGDLRVAGPGPDRDDAWEIRVEDPRNEANAFTFPLVDEALAQSSTAFRRWQYGQKSVHHLIDPRTGEPSSSGVDCAVVTARETWRAETLAKAALLAGPIDGIALLEHAGADGWLLGEDGVVHATAHVTDASWPNARLTQPVPQETRK